MISYLPHNENVEIGTKELTALGEAIASFFGILPDSLVELNFVSNAEIAEINKAYRQIDEPTDVLSFPTFSTLSEIKEREESEILLGGIIISPEKAIEYGETILDLVHHGTLHLLGFDHETDLSTWKEKESALIKTYKASNLDVNAIPDGTL